MSCGTLVRRMGSGLVLTLWASAASGQFTALYSDKKPEPPKPTEFVLSAATEPIPALRYRLLPLESTRTPGDAAPIYLRIRHEMNTEAHKQIQEKPAKWLELSDGEFPVDEARQLVDRWGNSVRQIEFGARRTYCDWSYTLPEQRLEAIEILLPDAQEMRMWARLLALKARVEIAEGKLDAAVRTLETGLSFGRHVGEGPFLINNLVGIAICNLMLEQAEKLVAAPRAPSLYWALTALPRPMVSLRKSMEIESRLGENLIPELEEVDEKHTPEEWDVLLARMYDRMQGLAAKISGFGSDSPELLKFQPMSLERFREQFLPEARKYLQDREGYTPGAAEQVPEAEALARYIAARYQELRDSVYKLSYLPYPEMAARYPALEKKLKEARSGAAGPLARMAGPMALFDAIQPALLAAKGAEVRLDQRIAALRVVEAIRLHAYANGGKLPESLDQISEVPVPVDPATGQAFVYKVEGESASLETPEGKLPPHKLWYRLEIRD